MQALVKFYENNGGMIEWTHMEYHGRFCFNECNATALRQLHINFSPRVPVAAFTRFGSTLRVQYQTGFGLHLPARSRDELQVYSIIRFAFAFSSGQASVS